MKKLIVGFSKPKSRFAVFGHLIRWYSGKDYSHCYIKFEELELISQASNGLVNFTHKDVFDSYNIVVSEFHVPVTDIQFDSIYKYAIKTAGKKYSTLQVIGVLFADLLKFDRNPFDMNKNTFICSEYLGQILKLLNIKLDKHLSLLAPEDIFSKLRELYGKV